MNKVIILLFLLASCATTNRFGQPKRELAAQLPDFFTSCLSNLHQLFQPPKLVIKNDEIYWHQESIGKYSAAARLYSQIYDHPIYPDLNPRFDDLFWAYLFSLPSEFQWLKEIAWRPDALDLFDHLAELFSHYEFGLSTSLRDWVLAIPNHHERQSYWELKEKWWRNLDHPTKQEIASTLKVKINNLRIDFFWKKFFYVPLVMKKVSEDLVQVSIGNQILHGKIKKNSLFLSVPPSMVKIRNDNPLNHLEETAARTSGPRKFYSGYLDLDGKFALNDGNHTFYLYSRTAHSVIIELAYPLKTVNLAHFFSFSPANAPTLEQIAQLLRGEIQMFDILPPSLTKNMPWTEADFARPSNPYIDLFTYP